MLKDLRNHPVTGATPDALEKYELALAELQCYRGDPLATIDAALTEAPGFAMARCLKAYLGLLATERPALDMARAELEALEPLALDARERGHRDAIHALAAGSWETGILALDRVLADHPRDVLALQAHHVMCFFVGDARNLRDGVARVRGAWDVEIPGFHAVLGMHAFGLEECGDYARAEREGRRALELEPRDAWAHHAVAHVLEMQGRTDDGVAWMTSREPHWAVDNFFSIHNWWHLALYHLDRGETERCLEIYDTRIRATRSRVVLDLIDASGMLWRLFVRGVELGDRWDELAEAWAELACDGLYAFNDAHAAMALIGGRRGGVLETLRHTMRREAESGSGSNRAMTRDVGLPVVEALAAVAAGDHARAVSLLLAARPIAHRFGGSHAQRDLLDQTLAEAALRAGHRGLALSLAREREELKPGQLFARQLRARALSLAPARPAAD
jgi:tetratricopeptide (TPR) repeat protein